jgi:SNF2 family DNA or RNA helicase
MDALRPGELGTREEFGREWCSGVGSDKSIKDPDAFGTYLREQGMMIRRTRSDVAREIPELTIIPHTVPSEDVFGDDANLTELAEFILSQTGKGIEQMSARGELDWRLRQATGLSKARYVAEFVRMLVDNGEQVLLGGWHHAVYAQWQKYLSGIAVAKFTGEQSPRQKQDAFDAFSAGRANVLMMSLRAGAGLDGLQKCCSTVVHGELDWSPSIHQQFTARIHRDGQDSPVMSYYLVSDEGSDPVIQTVLGIKRGQLVGVMDPCQEKVVETVKSDGVLDLAKAVLERKGRRRAKAPATEDHGLFSGDAS